MDAIGSLPASLHRLGAPAVDRWSFVRFDDHDSGCISYGIELDGSRYFVKFSTTPGGHSSLLNTLRFHKAVVHSAIVRPVGAVTGDHVVVVYPWIDGAVLNQASVRGSNRETLQRFRSLPASKAESAIDTVLAAHGCVVAAGFVSVDFYDGAMMYNFDTHSMHLVDLDEYRLAPFTVTDERLPGSLSYMAPEELRRGARIDERTMVFTMGRTIEQLLKSGDGRQRWSEAQAAVADRATALDRSDRYDTLSAMTTAWRNACRATRLASRATRQSHSAPRPRLC